MGRVVTFPDLPMEDIDVGVTRGWITPDGAREMRAELLRIAPGGVWQRQAPQEQDLYLFVRAGSATITAGDLGSYDPDMRRSASLGVQGFAVIGEGNDFLLEAGPSGAELIVVMAPMAVGRGLDGFAGLLQAYGRDDAPTLDVPAQKKKRILFVDDKAARSERGHAMIVEYQKDTVTGLHHHPDAESLFVVLDGALTFTVNGRSALVKPGQAAWFGCDDPHGLRVADDVAPGAGRAASFLEFHIPAGYTTVKHG